MGEFPSPMAHPSSNWESSEGRTEESAASCPSRPWCGDYRRAPLRPQTRTLRTPCEEHKWQWNRCLPKRHTMAAVVVVVCEIEMVLVL
jgi:hypothetical protein